MRFILSFMAWLAIMVPGWAELLTDMPRYPDSPEKYIDKWDPFVLQPLIGTTTTLSRNNGRQIARNAAGTWFILAESNVYSIQLGVATKPDAVGGDFKFVELVGSAPEAVFRNRDNLLGASMVIDAQDTLHVIWCDDGALYYASRNVGDARVEQLAEKAAWGEPRRLAEAPCRPGDIMLDADGAVAICYARNDHVYYARPGAAEPELVAGPGAGLLPLPGTAQEPQTAEERDSAKPPPPAAEKASYPPPLPTEERVASDVVMDLGPDGAVNLAFQRDFEIWYVRRTPEGAWEQPERAAYALAFHPAIIVAGGRPLICFQYEGIRKVVMDDSEYLARREGGGAAIGYAVKSEQGWRADYLAKPEEIIVNRQGIWDKRFEGKLIPMLEELWMPALFRDRHGVAWALWQNTTRRWAYCARWMGEGFGEVQECRGPFNAPGQPVSAEKLMPPDATDAGLLFFAADRIIFDRLKIPTLSLADAREVMFLDSLEVGETAGLEFVLNEMTKHPANPLITPGPPGSKDDRHVRTRSFAKRGDTYILEYSYQSWSEDPWKHDGVAVSADGIAWRKVDEWPADVPRGDGLPASTDPIVRGYFDNPDTSDPAKKFMRTDNFGPVWHQGSKRVLYSPDGQNWSDGPEISILNAIYEGGMPNLWDPLDSPERRIKIYGRIFTTNSRSCGMMWTQDLLHWGGAEHFLDPDDPYGTPPGTTTIGPMRGQVFLDACAGINEDQIYNSPVRIVEGLYLCIYWPCSFEHRFDGALAVSRDGFNFTRVKNGGRTLPVVPAGTWDSGVTELNWPTRDGDVLRLYYPGSSYHHGLEPHRAARMIGLATVRVNGWTYYTPTGDAAQGTLTTIPIDAPQGAGKWLTVNAENVTEDGALAVEVLDAASGDPLPGFGVEDFIAPASSSPESRVGWKASAKLPEGSPIRLRFHLRGEHARLYSFGFDANQPESALAAN